MHKKVFNLWKKIGTKYFWGDFLDSRFYIAYLVSKWKDEKILDVGCGAGVLLHFSNAKLKIGLDFSLDSLKVAKTLNDPKMELIQADSRFIPLKSNEFSKILAVHIISALHVSDKEGKLKIMSEIKRLSSKKAELVIVGANRKSKFFVEKYSKEENQSYLHFSEIIDFFKDDFIVNAEGYGEFSKSVMYLLRLIYKIPEKFVEFSGMERALYKILKSKKFLADGRSYIITCRR